MSPKIKDFAEHCDFYVGNEHYNESYEEKQRLWLEKFAEMIVQHCIYKFGQTRTEPSLEKYIMDGLRNES